MSGFSRDDGVHVIVPEWAQAQQPVQEMSHAGGLEAAPIIASGPITKVAPQADRLVGGATFKDLESGVTYQTFDFVRAEMIFEEFSSRRIHLE